MSTDLDSSELRSKLAFNWPTKCICNLCNCGSHSCYTFSLEETSDFRCKHKQTKGMNQSDEEDQFGGSNFPRPTCADFPNDERYLSSMATDLSRLKRSSPQSISRIDNDENDLLHVLVSRPEIAAKPRDNIVFEGDMDLKTTFETSYEALAKMRLDYWKKYQEQQHQQHDDQDMPASKACQGSSKQAVNKQKQPTSMNDHHLEECQNQISIDENRPTRQKESLVRDNSSSVSVVSTGKQRLFNSDAENEHLNKNFSKIVDPRQPVSINKAAQLEPPRRSPKLANDPKVISGGDKEQKTPRKLVKRQADNKNEIDIKNDDYIETSVPEQHRDNDKPINKKALPTYSNNNNYNYQDTTNTSTYIDPDLSPIIIYDANMNRLEKVGIRKRSKYRPSTSLRSGAHGLFGDQREEKVVLARNLEGQQFGPSMASAGLPNVKSVKTESPDSSNARNLNNLKQSNNLTYTDHNLIVDSKRKLNDNINMVDHIRDHDIVGRSTPIPQQPLLLPDNNDLSSQDATTQMMRDNMENLKLAQLEEDAAVEEIQRVTSISNDQNKELSNSQFNNQQQQHGRTSSTNSHELRDSSSSRHSKQQRTCQNQNFYLFENEYPEARTSPETGVQTNRDSAKFVRVRPHSRSFYNNLFRESPDFILTTGKFTEGEAKSSVANSRNRDLKPTKGNQFQDTSDQENSAAAAAATSGNDYDYNGGVSYGDDGTNDASMKLEKQRRAKSDGFQISNDPYNNSDNILDSRIAGDSRQLESSNKNEECRVCKLNQDYHYVGSQSGHKYFVERQ